MTISFSDIQKTFNERKDNPIYNTSYPLDPVDWEKYRVNAPLPFESDEILSFYIHIPFCLQLCSFCEYTRMYRPSVEIQNRYITTLKKDIYDFIEKYPAITLNGFDIGGGTPTVLEFSEFSLLMEVYENVIKKVKLTNDFEPSIEGTFSTLTTDNLNKIADVGIKRISLGIQSTDLRVMSHSHRKNVDLDLMKEKIDNAYRVGIKKINLDFMYGLKFQTIATLKKDLEIIKQLCPEQVTLYELRTNRIKEESHTNDIQRFEMYSFLFEELIKMGYQAYFGQNTFSLNKDDLGVSSYLRHRMREGSSYKGFGLSAQSMSKSGLSYNIGKDNNKLKDKLSGLSYKEEFTYNLPPIEIASKYIAISAYSGAFSISKLTEILQEDSELVFQQPLRFCIDNKLMQKEGDIIRITKKGFKNYGAVFSLFYSRETKFKS